MKESAERVTINVVAPGVTVRDVKTDVIVNMLAHNPVFSGNTVIQHLHFQLNGKEVPEDIIQELKQRLNVKSQVDLVGKLKATAYYQERDYIGQELELYVPPFSCDPDCYPELSQTEEPVFLKKTMIDFLHGSEKVLLLKGGPGSGKTLFGSYLQQECYLNKESLGSFESSIDPIIIFIYLPTLKDPVRHLIDEYFTNKFGSTIAAEMIEQLKKRKNVYFILDAYDEIESFQQDLLNVKNLYTTNQLHEWKEAKFIISCRTSFLNRMSEQLSDSYKKYFVPIEADRLRYDLLKIVQVALFTKDQINRYIDQYVERRSEDPLASVERKKWSAEDYKEQIRTLPNVDDLVKSPLLLKMTVQALPIIIAWHAAKKQNNPGNFIRITERDIFLAYLKDNLLRQEARLIQHGIKIPGNLRTKFLDFLINLCALMIENKLLKVEYRFHPDEIEEEQINEGAEWAKRFFGDPFLSLGEKKHKVQLKYLEMIRNNLTCFLVYEEGKWGFIHDSFRDKIDSIHVVELTNIQSKLRLTMSVDEARKKGIEEFSRVLFEEAAGHYYLTKDSDWASMPLAKQEDLAMQHSFSQTTGLSLFADSHTGMSQSQRDSVNSEIATDISDSKLTRK